MISVWNEECYSLPYTNFNIVDIFMLRLCLVMRTTLYRYANICF